MTSENVAFVSRFLMFCLNLAMLLCSVVLVVWGSQMLNKPYDRNLKDVVFNYNSTEPLASDKGNLRSWVWSVYWSMYGLSIGAFLIAIIGLIGSINHRKAVVFTFLFFMVPLVLLELGGSVTVWIKRGDLRKLIYTFVNDMYQVNSVFDISIIQDTYSCCGVFINSTVAFCNTNSLMVRLSDNQLSPCDVAVFDSVDHTMMITGIVFIPVLLFQLLLISLPVLILIFEPREEVKQKKLSQTSLIDNWTS